MPTQDSSAKGTHVAVDDVGAVLLDISCIRPFEHNPRRGENPEYDRIKSSIRTNGLDQLLVITQRPGSTDYIVHSGGNTRLLILKELYEETADDQFSHVPCLLKPWTSESDVLLAHLRENDLRGALTFIDKALAVSDIKQFLEKELDVNDISLRKLQAVLAAGGYSLSPGLISRMGYAVKRLLPLIPQALNAGLGRPQVQRIRALDRAALQIWKKHALGDDAGFDEVFAILCRRYDSTEWDTGLLHGALEVEIAEQAEISIQAVRIELDALLAGCELTIPELQGEYSETGEMAAVNDTEYADPTGSPELSKKDESRNDSLEQPDDSGNSLDQELSESADVASPAVLTELVAAPSSEKIEPVAGSILTTAQSGPSDLKSLRGRAWTLAARLAQRNGIGDLVVPLSGKGLGFILCNVPDPALADQLDDDTLSQVSMVWWHLAASSEMTVGPVDSIVPALPADSVLRQALEQQDAGLLFNSVWTLDPGHTGYRLWRRLGEQDWCDLLNLMGTYRQIHHLAEETDIRLWE